MLKPQPHSALQEPLFRRYFVASFQATLATWITRFLLGWIAWDLTQSALWVGVASACMLFPSIVFSPLFGVLSDRINPRNGMLVTLSAQAGVAAITAAAIAADLLSLTWLIGLALAIGGISSAHHPMRLALLPQLVSRERLPSAIGLSAIVFNISRIFGPAIAGTIIAQTSTTVAFLLAAALFAGALLALLRLKVADHARATNDDSLFAQLLAGLHFAVADTSIRLILLLTFVNGLLGRTVIELLPAVSGKLLGGGANLLALLTAAAGAGSILGGLLITRQRDNEAHMTRLVLINLAGSAAILLLVSWANNPWLLTPVVAYLGLATTMAGIGSQVLTQFVVNEAFRGRVMSLWTMFAMGAPALGGFVMGALADQLGFVAALTGNALLMLVFIGYLWRQARRIQLLA